MGKYIVKIIHFGSTAKGDGSEEGGIFGEKGKSKESFR